MEVCCDEHLDRLADMLEFDDLPASRGLHVVGSYAVGGGSLWLLL